MLPELKGAQVIGVGVFRKSEADAFAAVLPGTAFAEKDGTVVNSQGVEQRYQRAILPPGQSKALSEVLMMWSHGKEAGRA